MVVDLGVAAEIDTAPTLPVEPPPTSDLAPVKQPVHVRGFSNSIGMAFVPVAGTEVFFCVTETRVRDFERFARSNPEIGVEWKEVEYDDEIQRSGDPVVNVSWEEAKAFCVWLSKKEGKTYRLPTDHEWSVAVGIGDSEDAKATPKSKKGEIQGVYPWGVGWTPPASAGNYWGAEHTTDAAIVGAYRDKHPFTSPVGSYAANLLGIYDLGGNVWEWCEDRYDETEDYRVLRGGSWRDDTESSLLSSYREYARPESQKNSYGFRVVVEIGTGR